MAKGAFNDKTRRLVYERAKGRCERCGGNGDQWHFHHRRPRGMGGTSRKDSGGAENALLLHPSCHEWVERNRSDAYDMGYLVAQQANPRDTPVRLWDGWFILRENGSKTYLIPDVEEPVDLDAVQRGSDAAFAGVLPDQADDGSLADAKVNSDDIRRDTLTAALKARLG